MQLIIVIIITLVNTLNSENSYKEIVARISNVKFGGILNGFF